MGLDGALYKLTLVLHILVIVLGWGGVALLGAFGMQAKQRRGVEGKAIAEAAVHVGEKVAQPFIYLIPVFGVLLVVFSDDVWSFGETWIWLSLVLWVAAVGLSHAVHQPNLRQMNVLMAELAALPGPPAGGPPPQAVELEERGRRAGMVSAVLNLTFVAVLVLMVWKPGA
jgi:hypothetical protein